MTLEPRRLFTRVLLHGLLLLAGSAFAMFVIAQLLVIPALEERLRPATHLVTVQVASARDNPKALAEELAPAFEPDGSWDKITRRIGVNARLVDDFDATQAPVVVIDGKNLW